MAFAWRRSSGTRAMTKLEAPSDVSLMVCRSAVAVRGAEKHSSSFPLLQQHLLTH